MFSSSSVYASARTLYVPLWHISIAYQDSTESIAYRRNHRGHVDALRDDHFARLKRAVEVDVLRLLAKVRRRGEELDQTILYDKLDVGAVGDLLLDVPFEGDE